MGNKAEQFRRSVIKSGDAFRWHSINQATVKYITETQEKNYHPKSKAAKAEVRRLQKEQKEQFAEEIMERTFYWTLGDMVEGSATTPGINYVSQHVEVFGRVVDVYTTENETDVEITIVDFNRVSHKSSLYTY